MATHSGFSLIELLVVIAIISISAGMVTFGLKGYQTKSRVEAQVRQIATDINDLRIRALTTKQRHSIVLYPSYYVLKSYSTETYTTNDALVANGTPIGTNSAVSFRLKLSYADIVADTGTAIEINQRGMLAALPQTIFLATGASASSASINCLTVHTVRVNVGKQNDITKVCDDK